MILPGETTLAGSVVLKGALPAKQDAEIVRRLRAAVERATGTTGAVSGFASHFGRESAWIHLGLGVIDTRLHDDRRGPVADHVTLPLEPLQERQHRGVRPAPPLAAEHPELQALGYQVTWYQIPEASVEMKMALHFEKTQPAGPARMYLAPFNTKYRNVLGFSAEGSSTLKLRIVPVPPHTGA